MTSPCDLHRKKTLLYGSPMNTLPSMAMQKILRDAATELAITYDNIKADRLNSSLILPCDIQKKNNLKLSLK